MQVYTMSHGNYILCQRCTSFDILAEYIFKRCVVYGDFSKILVPYMFILETLN